jgi:hypothetical protein
MKGENMQTFKSNFLLVISVIVLGLFAYTSVYQILPFTEYKYTVDIIDSLIFISMYLVLQMTMLLYVDRASSRIADIITSVVVFFIMNLLFSIAEVGNFLSLYNSLQENKDFVTDPKKFACFTILLALIIDMTLINFFNFLYLRRMKYYVSGGKKEAEERINKEQILKDVKKKSDAQKKARQLEKDLVIANNDAKA